MEVVAVTHALGKNRARNPCVTRSRASNAMRVASGCLAGCLLGHRVALVPEVGVARPRTLRASGHGPSAGLRVERACHPTARGATERDISWSSRGSNRREPARVNQLLRRESRRELQCNRRCHGCIGLRGFSASLPSAIKARISTHHGYIHHVAQFTMNGDANDQTPTERQQASQDHQARRQGTFRLRPSRQRRAAHSPRGF